MTANPGRGTTAKGVTLVYAQILPVMAIVSLFPAIPKLMMRFGAIDHAAILVPMIVTIPSLMIALSSPFAGALADRLGRRRTFIGGMALYVVAGLVPVLTAHLGVIVVSRAILGIAEAFVVTVSSALIGDYFGSKRHRWVAWVGISTSIAGGLLIAAGGALADISWRGPFFVYVLAIPGLLLALRFIDEPAVLATRDTDRSPRAGYPYRQAVLIGTVTLASSLIYYAEPLHIAQILTNAGVGSAGRVGLLQAATCTGYVLGAFAYRQTHGLAIAGHLAIAALFIGVGQFGIGLGGGFAAIAAGAVIQQFGSGFVIPALLAWGQSILPPEQRGRGLGIWVTTFFAGTFLCPLLVTALSALAGGLRSAMVVVGIAALLLAAASFLFGMRPRPSRPLEV